mmetsp:Transcript_7479/g.10355  ORF Transcript_7479/g.10355 Transcript_7479/m.10355 type:complete len:97 (-) Transcript_7479:15-305(-)
MDQNTNYNPEAIFTQFKQQIDITSQNQNGWNIFSVYCPTCAFCLRDLDPSMCMVINTLYGPAAAEYKKCWRKWIRPKKRLLPQESNVYKKCCTIQN